MDIEKRILAAKAFLASLLEAKREKIAKEKKRKRLIENQAGLRKLKILLQVKKDVELARYYGIHKQSITLIKKGRRPLSKQMLQDLSKSK